MSAENPYLSFSQVLPGTLLRLDDENPIGKTPTQLGAVLELTAEFGFSFPNNHASRMGLNTQQWLQVYTDPDQMDFQLFMGRRHSDSDLLQDASSTLLLVDGQNGRKLQLATTVLDSKGIPRVVATEYGNNGLLTRANISCSNTELPIPLSAQGKERYTFQTVQLPGNPAESLRSAGLITNGMIERTELHPHVVRFQYTQDSGPRVIPYELMDITTPVEEAGFGAYETPDGQAVFHQNNQWSAHLPLRLT